MLKNLEAWMLRNASWFGRISIFIIFFWFGLLKILNISPAEGVVTNLHSQTISFIPFEIFYPFLGLVEMSIGILFLIPKLTRIALIIMVLQMFTTFLPLIFLPGETWTQPGGLTLEGQYIVKNLALVSLAILIYKDKYSLSENKK